MRIAALLVLVGAAWAAKPESGIWKMNPVRSNFSGDTQPRSFTVRVEPHSKGEVFTLDRVETDGRATSSSTILYFDGGASGFSASRMFRNAIVVANGQPDRRNFP